MLILLETSLCWLTHGSEAPPAQAGHFADGTSRAEKSVLTESSSKRKPEAVVVEFCRCVGEGDNSMSKIEQLWPLLS